MATTKATTKTATATNMTAKMSKVQKAELVKKQVLDKEITECMELDTKIKAMKEEFDKKKAELEKRYNLPADVIERFEGLERFMEKVTIRRDKVIDVKQLRVLLDACGLDKSELIKRHWAFDIDDKQIKKHIKEGIIPAEAYNKLVTYKTITFKSKFGLI